MNKENETSPFQGVVPGAERGGSGLPGAAQRAVPGDTADLRARLIVAEQRLKHARLELIDAEQWFARAELIRDCIERDYEASKTAGAGNVAISCEGGHTQQK